MDKKKLLVNYCHNTALDGFEEETDYIKGNIATADLFCKMASCFNLDLTLVIVENAVKDMLTVPEINGNFELKKGMLDMLEDLKQHAQNMEDPSFLDEYEYEIYEGVFKNYEE